jgi:RNA polymerase sigma-70 factor, ECF subfamily
MSLKKLNDQELVVSYLNGNSNAFETLLLRHKNKIYRLIFLKVKDADLANDLFQDTFIKIINTIRLGNYNDEGKFLPWAMRIANNLVIDYFRKNKKIKFYRDNVQTKEEYSIFSVLKCENKNELQNMCNDEINAQMLELLPHLPIDQQEIIKFRFFDDLSFKEIAEIKNISINTALGRMRYAILNLRKIVEENKLILEY